MNGLGLVRRLATGAALAGALLAGGCISLLPEPPDPPAVFALRAGDDLAAAAPDAARPLSIAVLDVSAPAALSGPQLPVILADGSLAYVRGAEWTEDAPDALRSLILETFDRTRLANAAAASTGARGDVALSVDLVTFALTPSRRRAPAQAEIVLVARLLDGRNRSVLAVQRFAVEGPAGDDGPAGASRALTGVARTAATDIVRWTVATAGTQEPPPPPRSGR